MADHLGAYNTLGSRTTVRFAFTTHAASGAAVAPSSAFENSDLRIYKDGSATQRSSASGITMTSPFDSITGGHHVDIDLTDNTDAGFYAAGSFYEVWLVPDETVDSLAVVRVLAYFEIGPPQVNVVQLGGDAQSATDLKDFADAGYDPGTNKVQGVVLTDTVTTYTGNTPQTGDAYAAVGALNNLSAAQVNAEVDTALADINLDHLIKSAVDTDFPTTVHLNSVIGHLADNGTSASYDRTTDSLEVLGAATAPSAASIADAVWEEAIADHSGTVGSTAEALGAAGSAGDPWTTALPGSYGAGQAGKIVGDNLNATVSSRATQTSVDDLPTNAELATALGTADDAVLAAIAALNNLSQANVRTAVGLASADLDTQLSGIQSDTNDIQGRLPAALTGAGNMKADALAVDGSTTAATNLKSSATVIYVGTVAGTPTTTTLEDSGLTQADTDHWKGRIIIFLTGTLKYQGSDITAFDETTDTLTFTALTRAPTAGDTYVIL